MNPDRFQFLSLIRQLPARLTVDEAAWFLGFFPHEIPILVSKKVLKPIGNPTPQSTKYFASAELEKLRINLTWLAKASRTLTLYQHARNEKQAQRRRLKQKRKERGRL